MEKKMYVKCLFQRTKKNYLTCWLNSSNSATAASQLHSETLRGYVCMNDYSGVEYIVVSSYV